MSSDNLILVLNGGDMGGRVVGRFGVRGGGLGGSPGLTLITRDFLLLFLCDYGISSISKEYKGCYN